MGIKWEATGPWQRFFGVKPGEDKDTLSPWFYWGPTSRNTQTGKDILGGNFILGGKTGKAEEISAQLL